MAPSAKNPASGRSRLLKVSLLSLAISAALNAIHDISNVFVHGALRRSSRSDSQQPRTALPIIGDTMKLMNPKTMASYQVDGRSKWGPVWKTSVLFKNAVMVTGTAELAEAWRLESRPNATKAFFPPHHQKLFGRQSLLVQSGPQHAKLRRLIQAVMIPKAVASYRENIDAGVAEFLTKCRSETGYFSMTEKLRSAMVSIMFKILFGQKGDSSETRELIADVTIWSKGLLAPPLTFIPWSTAARAMRARARVAAIIKGWMISCDEAENTLLSRMVFARDDDGNRLSEEEILDNVFTLVFAATDTTASSLSSSFLRLSQSPDLQQQLREICAEGEPDVVAANLNAFISEAMRTSPPAPFAMRMVEESLEVGNVTIPAGWLMVYGFAGACLSDDKQYPDPQEFRWNRTLPEGKGLADGPFGGGPRMCPGRFLAAEAAKTVLQEVLGPKGIYWTLKPGQDLSQRYTPGLFPVDGLQMSLSDAAR